MFFPRRRSCVEEVDLPMLSLGSNPLRGRSLAENGGGWLVQRMDPERTPPAYGGGFGERERCVSFPSWWVVENHWTVVGFRMPGKLNDWRSLWWSKNVTNERSDQQKNGPVRKSRKRDAKKADGGCFFFGGGETRKMNGILQESS